MSLDLIRSSCYALLGLALLAISVPRAAALPRTWIGGNVDWVDGGSDANWNPADEPDSVDEAIFNMANTVHLGSNNAVNGLTMSGGIDLRTNDFDLTVDGLVDLSGAGTNLFIDDAAGSVNADNLTISAAGGTVELQGGLLTLDEEVGTSLLDNNVGGTISGHGVITFADVPLAFTTVFSNDGALTALSRPAIIFNPPPVGTLQINATGGLMLIDLDGAANAGIVNVNRNQTLDVNGTLADAFGGAMTLAHNAKLDISTNWGMNAGTLTANNGFVAGGIGVDPIQPDVSIIAGGTLTQSGGVINVADTDGTLQFDAPFTMNGGSFTNFGTVIFNGVASITTAAGYAPSDINSQTIVNANVTINDGVNDFNWDGNGAADTTVNGTAIFTVTAMHVDSGNDTFGGTLTLNDNADASVTVAAGRWTAGGSIVKNNAGTSTVGGSRVDVTGSVTVNGGTLSLPATTLASTANVTVNSTLTMGAGSEFNGPTTLTGPGLLRMDSTSTVLSNSTVNVATFDWDGLAAGSVHTINAGATFTINSAAFDTDGDMDDPLVLAGDLSQLVVNNTNGITQWTMNGVTTANSSGAGTATIGGTSRMIVTNTINVDGNTNISAPVTFNGLGIVADIDSGKVLDVTSSSTMYADGTIDGAGTFDPGVSNIVTGDFAINSDRFDFDGGTWTVESGATLTFNSAIDYEPDSVTNSFESTITLNNGAILANVADPAVVMNGTLNMNASAGNGAEWNGDAIEIGNDAGVLDANLNVTGDGNPNSQGRFVAPVTFKSDADVDVPANAFLNLTRVVNFDTVNAANNAEFTGAGTIAFNNTVNVNEAVTLNMVGGTVDLDGNDATGEFINVDAPLTINAATASNFGRVNGGGGTNTLDVNNSVGTGVLSVNLDDPAAEWTLNGPGVMNLVNDNAPATLLSGSAVNINGTLNVTGDVRTTARLDVAGAVNINTAAEPLRLAGGGANVETSNHLLGGTINGPGVLGADTGKNLIGFGSIGAIIDFDGLADLIADDGMLTVSGSIVDVGVIGALDDGILNVVNPWNSGVAVTVLNQVSGEIRGGTITIDNPNGVIGKGLVSARIINNTRIGATRHFVGDSGTHVFQTAANDNDWDGAAGVGTLLAEEDHTLEIRDNATFGFTGTVQVAAGGRVFANGFALDFNPGSTINLNSGTYESTSSTDIGGTVAVGAGPDSTIKVQNNFFLTFETGSSTTLNGNLQLQNNNVIVEAGAAFSGTGALIVDEPSHAVLENGATVNVLLVNEGAIRPGNSEGIGTATVKDYVQTNTGELFIELTGTLPNAYDRILASQTVQLDGVLNLDIDGVFVPALGNTFDIISSVFGRSGTFDYVDVSGMPAGLAFHVDYLANAVRLTVVNKPIFSADFDDDGDVDPTDLAIWRGAFNLNQLGDADGDNDSDGADLLLWQQQLGSAPTVAVANTNAAAVPEPANLASFGLVALLGLLRKREGGDVA
jgi:hypothetical protein